jgi:hypothetical protein
MIEINFLDSSDKEIIGKYKFFYDTISIGTSNQNDLIIQDLNLNESHLTLSITNGTISCEGIGEFSSFIYKSKTFKGKKAFIKKDQIKIGNTTFEIVDFSLEPPSPKGLSLKESYESLLKEFPEQEKIIDEMENEISKIEGLIIDQPSNS